MSKICSVSKSESESQNTHTDTRTKVHLISLECRPLLTEATRGYGGGLISSSGRPAHMMMMMNLKPI